MSFNPEMMIVARESRKLTQTALAESMGVTQSKISKLELGSLEPKPEDVVKLAKLLDYPPDFFAQSDRLFGLTGHVLYRKKASLASSEQKVVEAQANILRIRLARLLRGVDIESPNQFPHFDVDSYDDGPAEVARRVRAQWGLPSGPIRNVVGSIESAGGVVFEIPFGTDRLDAVIQYPMGLPPMFLLNTSLGASGERRRFTLAHEIGHAVMRNFASPDPETEANQFASEFLMPEREIGWDLENLNLVKAFRLKPYWRVSVQALVRRARDLEKISERKYRSLCTEISAKGMRTVEPNPIPAEAPSLVRDVVEAHIHQMNFDIQRLAKHLLSSEQDFREQFPFTGGDRRGLSVVG